VPCVNGRARATRGSPDARPVNAGIGTHSAKAYSPTGRLNKLNGILGIRFPLRGIWCCRHSGTGSQRRQTVNPFSIDRDKQLRKQNEGQIPKKQMNEQRNKE
jgi:hypothetical protein